ncbi:uncharacterized protein LOC119277072 isoform X2 [Triticum dicoccoides]|uniref:uncharacterized protein LOC119277072 isoform X2 n=1 Tax=Triticum dicoccoides TaxID=85692 RepID=UPI00188E981E|nr:uncharacterized protein LOC119277072 isoform X2 [Triticum dicoccoides]
MQARAFPPCLPGPGRNGLFLGSFGKRAPAVCVRAVDGPSAAAAVADLPPAEVTWQIVVGAVAGVTPFVVAGVEFGKRIVVFFHGSRGEDSSKGENHQSHVTSILLDRTRDCMAMWSVHCV